MLVKKYAIYKIKTNMNFVSDIILYPNNYNNEISFKLNPLKEYGCIGVYIPKSSLFNKLPDDNNSEYFDTEWDAIRALELNKQI
jgi:hypothetical protein